MPNISVIKEQVKDAIKLRKRIQDMLFSHHSRTSGCYEGVNPYYNQLDECVGGVMVEYYYGVIQKIYTPLGYLPIWWGSFSWDSDSDKWSFEEDLESVGLELIEPAHDGGMGTFGGWYKIGKTTPVLRERSDYVLCDEAHRIYNECIAELQQEGFELVVPIANVHFAATFEDK